MAQPFEVYSSGLCMASVCSEFDVEETTRRLNEEHPTGIPSRWAKSSEDFRTGEKNPFPCARNPKTHKHYLFFC